MALLGQGTVPVGIDYSQMGADAWRLAQSNTSAIAGAMGAVADAVKDRKEKKEKIKVSEDVGNALMTLFPETQTAIAPILEKLKDEESPLSQRAVLGEQLYTLANMGIEKMRNDAMMSLERSRLGLDTRRVDLAESAFRQEGESMVAAAMSENDIKKNEALSRYAAIKEMEAPLVGQLPKMDTSEDLITKYLEQDKGEQALNAVEAYEAARIKQMEPLLGAPKLTRIAGTDAAGMPLEIDAFVTPTGQVLDINQQPLTAPRGPATQGGLPATPDTATDALLPPLEETRRTVPMPDMPRIGIRPAGTPTPRTPTQQALDEAKLRLAEQEVKTAESTVAKEQATKQASLANAQDAVKLIDTLKTHPGFEAAVGSGFSKTVLRQDEAVRGTDRAGAEAIINQLKGQAFLNAIQQLRGLGALSDAEGAKLQQAAARLDANQSEKDFKAALDEYKAMIQAGIDRAQKGELAPGVQPPAAQSAAERLRALKR